MATVCYLELDGAGMVIGKHMVTGDLVQPEAVRPHQIVVSEAMYDATAIGATQNPDGTFTNPPPTPPV